MRIMKHAFYNSSRFNMTKRRICDANSENVAYLEIKICRIARLMRKEVMLRFMSGEYGKCPDAASLLVIEETHKG